MAALTGAKLVSGFNWFAETTGLDQLLASAEEIWTGEGQLDCQTLQGKVLSGQLSGHHHPFAICLGFLF